MILTEIAFSLLAVGLIAGGLSLIANRSKESSDQGLLSSYLLAGGSLGRTKVGSLLMSSSFGLNSIFYAAWLGYSIGLWALVIQLFWSVSFFRLARHAEVIHRHKSMHHFLGHDFGRITRVVAGCFSLVGMMCFIGWEIEITRSTLGNVLSSVNNSADSVATTAFILAVCVVAVCLFYTVLGGLRGNALADEALNVTKIVCVLALIIGLSVIAGHSNTLFDRQVLLPSREDLSKNLGILGFITNAAFNVAWQFVDASSWQSVIAGRQKDPSDAGRNLVLSGKWIFFVPGVIGTILGIVLHSFSGVTSDNIIGQATILGTPLSTFFRIAGIILIIACVMSLLDGMFLACAFTLIVDIVYPSESLTALEAEATRAEVVLFTIRLTLIAIAIVASFGVHWLLGALHLSIFAFVYVLIISQLCLLGPILAGLNSRKPKGPMWVVLLLSALVGFSCVWAGTHGYQTWWADIAGTLTSVVSITLAYSLSRARPFAPASAR
jgi:hypothetical protein